ncbi:hypothetical protein VNO77_32266 [Canavalia gladiata]|uniref:Uncharacterized protein n=1 Tax=Canavalia gladiata TaxID=3824 RepID=A0AAN9KR38_CANGL
MLNLGAFLFPSAFCCFSIFNYLFDTMLKLSYLHKIIEKANAIEIIGAGSDDQNSEAIIHNLKPIQWHTRFSDYINILNFLEERESDIVWQVTV